MSSKPNVSATNYGTLEQFPDFPTRDDMQNPMYLYRPGHLSALELHFGSPETTLVMGEVPVGWHPSQREGIRIPDLLIAFNVETGGIFQQDGYAIDRVGKPPDFALEVASKTTGTVDYTQKRRDYEAYGIREYWRYDPSGGRYHEAALAGDRLIDGRYQPVDVVWTEEARCHGYSEILGLFVCWEAGELRWYDPATETYLLTAYEQVERANREAASRRETEREVERLRQRLQELGESV